MAAMEGRVVSVNYQHRNELPKTELPRYVIFAGCSSII